MTTRTRIAGVLFVVSAVLIGLAWMFMGSAEAPPVVKHRVGVGRVAKRVQGPVPALRKSPQAEAAALPDDGVAAVTAPCKYIIEWQQSNVPDFVILDNLAAQSQRFVEKDLACLTASGASSGVLQYAERNMKTPRLKDGDKVQVIE